MRPHSRTRRFNTDELDRHQRRSFLIEYRSGPRIARGLRKASTPWPVESVAQPERLRLRRTKQQPQTALLGSSCLTPEILVTTTAGGTHAKTPLLSDLARSMNVRWSVGHTRR